MDQTLQMHRRHHEPNLIAKDFLETSAIYLSNTAPLSATRRKDGRSSPSTTTVQGEPHVQRLEKSAAFNT